MHDCHQQRRRGVRNVIIVLYILHACKGIINFENKLKLKHLTKMRASKRPLSCKREQMKRTFLFSRFFVITRWCPYHTPFPADSPVLRKTQRNRSVQKFKFSNEYCFLQIQLQNPIYTIKCPLGKNAKKLPFY